MASWATSSASALLRKTPRATRKARGPHSARRSSNSRRNSAAATGSDSGSRVHSVCAAVPGLVRANSCIRLVCEPNALALPLQLPDAAVGKMVRLGVETIYHRGAEFAEKEDQTVLRRRVRT